MPVTHISPSDACRLLVGLLIICFIDCSCPVSTLPYLQVGTYSLNVNDRIFTFCYSVPVQVSGQISHTVTLGKVQQKNGVLYGKKAFSVVSKFNSFGNSLSFLVSAKQKYELTWLQVVYFVSGLPSSVYLGSHIEYQWDWASQSCASNITSQTGKSPKYQSNAIKTKYENNGLSTKLIIGFPSNINAKNNSKGLLVMLGGMHCPTQNCSASIISANLDSNTISINYEFSKVVDIFSRADPIQIFFCYIIYDEQEISFLETTEFQHEFKVAGLDKKYNNNLLKNLPQPLIINKEKDMTNFGTLDIADVSSIIFPNSQLNSLEIGVLKRIQSVLNWFSLVAIQVKNIQDGTKCISESECTRKGGNVIKSGTQFRCSI